MARELNFLEDLIQGVVQTLDSERVDFDESDRHDRPVLFLASYLEFLGKTISETPRVVHLSNELRASSEWKDHQASIENLAGTARRGEPLQPFQSKRTGKFDQNDMLLSDWNIHHLHLGGIEEGEKFSKRTGALLYATFLPTDAYFIAVMDHTSFAEVELLEIIESNWPSYLDRYSLKGFLGITPVPTSDDIKDLRRAGVQAMIQLRSGRILASPGGGYSTASTSVGAMMEAQRIARLLRSAEKFVRDNDASVAEALKLAPEERVRLAELRPDRLIFTRSALDLFYEVPVR